VLAARVDQLVLEFARKGLEDLRLIKEYGWPFQLGLGVIDVMTPTVETPELVAERIRRAIEYVEPRRLMVKSRLWAASSCIGGRPVQTPRYGIWRGNCPDRARPARVR
jgi:methionine synthase II (cobalamin-independent)